MFVASLTIQFHLPGCTSLKEKRFVLKSLKDRLRNRFNVALCETGYQDKWQRSEISVVTVAGSRKGLDKSMQSIITYIEKEERAVLIEIEKEIY
ncbi:MAG: DUF503 domain-containing protein [Candidatus Krumholzibacteriota bacterium]|nr:DUF503 domain-containing protein [Candidatus Krumholzibacteriota bacterium]